MFYLLLLSGGFFTHLLLLVSSSNDVLFTCEPLFLSMTCRSLITWYCDPLSEGDGGGGDWVGRGDEHQHVACRAVPPSTALALRRAAGQGRGGKVAKDL